MPLPEQQNPSTKHDPELRAFEFFCENLQKDVVLALKMSKLTARGVPDHDPVLWKKVEFSAKGVQEATIIFSGRPGFYISQSSNDGSVKPQVSQPCMPGEVVTITQSGEDFIFSEPLKGEPKYIEALNDTMTPLKLGVGVVDMDTNRVNPLFLFNTVVPKTSLKLDFIPVIEITAHVGKVIKGDGILVWKHDLFDLDTETTLHLFLHPVTRQPMIRRL